MTKVVALVSLLLVTRAKVALSSFVHSTSSSRSGRIRNGKLVSHLVSLTIHLFSLLNALLVAMANTTSTIHLLVYGQIPDHPRRDGAFDRQGGLRQSIPAIISSWLVVATTALLLNAPRLPKPRNSFPLLLTSCSIPSVSPLVSSPWYCHIPVRQDSPRDICLR